MKTVNYVRDTPIKTDADRVRATLEALMQWRGSDDPSYQPCPEGLQAEVWEALMGLCLLCMRPFRPGDEAQARNAERVVPLLRLLAGTKDADVYAGWIFITCGVMPNHPLCLALTQP